METGFTPTLACKQLEFRILQMKPRFHPLSPNDSLSFRRLDWAKHRLLRSD